MENKRYIIIDTQEMVFANSQRVYSLEISNKSFCDFYIKLFAFFGKENQIQEEGFSYYIMDTKTGIKFSAELTGFGAGYFGREEDLKLIMEFEKLRQTQTPVECLMEYEHDYGKTILGFTDGSPYFKEINY